jgi:hypothetical protein
MSFPITLATSRTFPTGFAKKVFKIPFTLVNLASGTWIVVVFESMQKPRYSFFVSDCPGRSDFSYAIVKPAASKVSNVNK